MNPRRRDGLLALVTCTLLIAISIRVGRTEPLLNPMAAVVGTIGSLALELWLLQHPERTRAIWARPGVQATGIALVLAMGVVAWWLAPWVLGVLVWGLLAYLALLVVVVATDENPLARVGRQS